MTSSFRLLSLLPFLLQVYAANDWSTPCLNGACQYSITSQDGSSGTVKIWGADNAISDITTAAGWEILDCSADKLNQDIRLVCQSEDTEAAGCSHLYNEGAENKIVRLPESCGKSAFARVAKAWTPEDQSIPNKVAARVVRRDGKQPTVRALSLDTDFGKTDTSKWGAVNFAIQGANFPGQDVNGTAIPTGPQRRSRFAPRILGGIIDKAGEIVDKTIEKIESANEFDVNKNVDLPPININKNFNLFRGSINCGPANADVSADVFANANAVISLGVAAVGTIAPPKIDDFQVVGGMNADLDGTLSLTANVGGLLDSGNIKIFQIGIPGLNFPGILEVGPTFEVNARAVANLDVNMDVTVGLTYQINGAEFTFPKKDGDKTKGDFKLGDTRKSLLILQNRFAHPNFVSSSTLCQPSVQALGSIEAHVIPELSLGVSAFADIASAKIFVRADASAEMQLDLAASADRTITKGTNNAGGGTAAGTEEDGEVVEDDGEVVEDDGEVLEDGEVDGEVAEDDGEVVEDDGEVLDDEETGPRTVTETLTLTTFVDPTPTAKSSSKTNSTNAAKATDAAEVKIKARKESSMTESKAAESTAASKDKAGDKKGSESASATATAAESTETATDDTEVVDEEGDVVDETDDGEVVDEEGEVIEDDGTVVEDDGTEDGTVVEDDGTVEDDETVVEGDEEVLDDGTAVEDGTVDTKTFGGCFKVLAGLNVNAGAQGSFFNFFNDQTVVPLFTKNFELFKKCFGDQADQGTQATGEETGEVTEETAPARKRSFPRVSRLPRSSLERRQANKNKNQKANAFSCLKNSIKPQPLVNQKVKSNQAKAL
ncbi:hypothetical protein VNI00_005373 [Paramarasmius palmivorus]|uniref:Uncharacterized protein n=1 Tax=Paramarasmius palmivorus TaxID=297713 RepID=A0AAW0DGK4_9AGAR